MLKRTHVACFKGRLALSSLLLLLLAAPALAQTPELDQERECLEELASAFDDLNIVYGGDYRSGVGHCNDQRLRAIAAIEALATHPDLLNEQGITTVFRFSGGFKLWGNRTAAFPGSTDTKDVFLPVRRMFAHVAHTLTLSVWQKVDNPSNRRLIDGVVASVNQTLNAWAALGALLGQPRVLFQKQDNPASQLLDGHLKFRLLLIPPPPAESIEFMLEFEVGALDSLFA